MSRDKNENVTSKVFYALSHPIRLKIIEILFDTKRPLHIKAISRQLQLDYAIVYRHVESLRRAGIVDVYEVGRSRVLSISRPKGLKDLLESAKTLYSSE